MLVAARGDCPQPVAGRAGARFADVHEHRERRGGGWEVGDCREHQHLMAVENNEGLAKDPIRWYSSNSSFIFTQSYYVRLTGKRMNALFAARRFDKCACVGVYTGTQNWLSSGTRSLELEPPT